MTLQGRQM